jgi:hypothetical protein
VEWNNELLLLLVEEREREREGGMIEEVDRLAACRRAWCANSIIVVALFSACTKNRINSFGCKSTR